MNPLTKIVIWYNNEYGQRFEYITNTANFKQDATAILEICLTKQYIIYYTIGTETKELEYYNAEL